VSPSCDTALSLALGYQSLMVDLFPCASSSPFVKFGMTHVCRFCKTMLPFFPCKTMLPFQILQKIYF